MKNPFEKLQITDLILAQNLSTDQAWQDFLNDCLEDGSAQALAKLSKWQRGKYMKMLKEAVAPWWKPNDAWQGINKALQAITP